MVSSDVNLAPPTGRPTPARRWLIGFAVWTALGLVSALQSAVTLRQLDLPVHWFPLLLDRTGDWYTCAIFTPLYFWLVRRFPLDGGRWARHLPVHLAAVVGVALVKIPLFMEYTRLLNLRRFGEDDTLRAVLVHGLIPESMALGAMLAVIHGIEMHWRARERELQAARLQGQLADARLAALTASLQPHFLFNTLHAVSTLMHRDVEAADRMIVRLSDLLRRSLADGGAEVPVAAEMELVRIYLSIMELRFGDRLSPRVELDPAAADALVPRLILQPLVENAIRHGIARRPGAGRLEVVAAARGGRLVLSVADDGPGAEHDGDAFSREGIGLSNTRQRLREMFGEDHEVRLTSAEGGGVEVRLELPLRRAPEAAP